MFLIDYFYFLSFCGAKMAHVFGALFVCLHRLCAEAGVLYACLQKPRLSNAACRI